MLSVEDRLKNVVSVLSLLNYSIYCCKSSSDLIWLLKIENAEDRGFAEIYRKLRKHDGFCGFNGSVSEMAGSSQNRQGSHDFVQSIGYACRALGVSRY